MKKRRMNAASGRARITGDLSIVYRAPYNGRQVHQSMLQTIYPVALPWTRPESYAGGRRERRRDAGDATSVSTSAECGALEPIDTIDRQSMHRRLTTGIGAGCVPAPAIDPPARRILRSK